MQLPRSTLAFFVVVISFLCGVRSQAQLPPDVVDTQPTGEYPPTPQASLAKITVPDGFHVTLFAGEPDVYQPIDMTFDDRGRLWVVENFSYPDWDSKDADRILIFEDSDNDGQFDSRKVFADKLSNITGIALGFGGVWACATPELIFIPDRNKDDSPDGPPIVKLDGWNDLSDEVEHNVFNGLVWGPDGWMYGGHGILADSLIGKPGAPVVDRKKMNCGIWRFHPTTEQFEIVAHGTTNPWGIDFDEMGQGFFTNSVIGHLWHLIPGARYERMYGTHFNPHAYALIGQCADHYHWGGGRWTESRGGKGVHNDAGGGHAHVGAMIYRGGVWPDEYHGSLFTVNLHGNRLNRDTIEQLGSGYTARHAPDFLKANDPWFRGIDLLYGPDGNVLMSDWTDLGECHDSDGTHRSSGRIYKVSYGDDQPAFAFDLSTKTSEELLRLADHTNAWYWSHARRLLHERSARGDDMSPVVELAKRLFFDAESTPSRRLRMLNAIAIMSRVDRKFIVELLGHDDEFVQCWAVRFLSDSRQIDTNALKSFSRLVPTAGPRTRLEIASAMQKTLSLQDQYWALAALMIYKLPAEDPNLLAMVWGAIEPLAKQDLEQFHELARVGQEFEHLAPIRQFVARRALSEYAGGTVGWRQQLDAIMANARRMQTAAANDILTGTLLAMKGERNVSTPKYWRDVRQRLLSDGQPSSRRLANQLSIKFKEAATIRRIRQRAADVERSREERVSAIALLADNRVAGTLDLLLELLDQPSIQREVIQSLKQFNKPTVARALLSRFHRFDASSRDAAVSTLVSSRQHAKELLAAVESGELASTAIKPTQALAIYQLRDRGLRSTLKSFWGDVRASSRAQQQQIADWKAELSGKTLAGADLNHGARVFHENCGKCHKLFGRGGDIGPDLTGSDRRNLDYILQNVVTPSAIVGREFRMQTVLLHDGRIISGALREQTPGTIVLQTTDKRVTLRRRDIVSIEPSELSLMPEGQFEALPKRSVRDLVAYLQSDEVSN